MERVRRFSGPFDLHRTLGSLRHGHRDPTFRTSTDGAIWRTTRTPDGPATMCLRLSGPSAIACDAWGSGASWILEQLPSMCGQHVDFAPGHPLLERVHRSYPGIRIPRTERVFESLVPAILEQKVTGKEATASFARLVRAYGEPAPGPAPAGMVVPPGPEVWRQIPSWEWHRAGVDPRRMRTVLAAAPLASRLEEAVALSPEAAAARLRAVPGVGEWTAAEVAVRALGDTDAVSVGDFHTAALVGWALLGEPLDDPGLVAFLEPWRPHRALVVRLVELSGVTKPRFGPRLTIQDHRQH